jgi:hypothetical protein
LCYPWRWRVTLRRRRRGMASGNTPTAMAKQRLPEEK